MLNSTLPHKGQFKMTEDKILLMKEKILADIESVYQRATQENKWNAAIQAKLAQAKVIVLFLGKTDQSPEESLPKPQLADLEFVFECALEEGKLGDAIRAKLAQARIITLSLGRAARLSEEKPPEPTVAQGAVTA